MKKRATYFIIIMAILFVVSLINQNIKVDSLQVTGMAERELQQCRADSDCDLDFNCFRGICGACLTENDCKLEYPLCDGGRCVTCERDGQCPEGYFCNEAGGCEAIPERPAPPHVGEVDSCLSDAECPVSSMCGGEHLCVRYGSDGSCVTDTDCQGRMICNPDTNKCEHVPLLPAGAACEMDGITLLGLACQDGVCSEWPSNPRRVIPGAGQCMTDQDCREPQSQGPPSNLICQEGACIPYETGLIMPNTIGNQCVTDRDCEGNYVAPYVLCQEGICKSGFYTSCRLTDCSRRYPCERCQLVGPGCVWDKCSFPSEKGILDPNDICNKDFQCRSGICLPVWTTYLGYHGQTNMPGSSTFYGRCANMLKKPTEPCKRDEQCESGRCIEGIGRTRMCDTSKLFDYCTSTSSCQQGLQCEGGICTENKPSPILPDSCEGLEELVPGFNIADRRIKKRINLVFVMTRTPDDLSLREQRFMVLKMLNFFQHPAFPQNGLFTKKPFSDNRNRFNLWFASFNPYHSDEEMIEMSFNDQNYFRCVTKASKDEEHFCPLNSKVTTTLCFINSPKAQTDMGTHEIVIARGTKSFKSPAVLTHEMGHAFGFLADEYDENELNKKTARFPNCADNKKLAVAWWGDLIGRGEGDVLVGLYDKPEDSVLEEIPNAGGCRTVPETVRPTSNSIMRHLDRHEGKEWFFGLVNERQLCYRILEETGNVDAQCMEKIMEAPGGSYREHAAKFSGSLVKSVRKRPKASETIKMTKQSSPQEMTSDKQQTDQPANARESGWTKEVLHFAVVKGTQGYTIPYYRIEQRYPYISYFEDNQFSDSAAIITSKRVTLTKGIALQQPIITESLVERGEVGTFELEDVEEVLVDIPLEGADVAKGFALRLQNKEKKLDLTFTCAKGTCKPDKA